MKYGRFISKIILCSIFLLLLLKINFTLWNSTYYKRDLEDLVRQEMQIIEESGQSNSTLSELTEKINLILSIGVLFVLGILFVFCSFDTAIVKKADNITYPDTLVARYVRLND